MTSNVENWIAAGLGLDITILKIVWHTVQKLYMFLNSIIRRCKYRLFIYTRAVEQITFSILHHTAGTLTQLYLGSTEKTCFYLVGLVVFALTECRKHIAGRPEHWGNEGSPCSCHCNVSVISQHVQEQHVVHPWCFLYSFLDILPQQERYSTPSFSVADPDPDPPDSHVFGPPGSRSGSISQKCGSGSGSGSSSGSFYHHAKIVRKTLIPPILWLFLTFYLWKIMWMYIQKVISRKFCKKIVFC